MKQIVFGLAAITLIVLGSGMCKPAMADTITLSASPTSGSIPLQVTFTNYVSYTRPPKSSFAGYKIYYKLHTDFLWTFLGGNTNPNPTDDPVTVYIYTTQNVTGAYDYFVKDSGSNADTTVWTVNTNTVTVTTM